MATNNKESKEAKKSGVEGENCQSCCGFMGHNHGFHKYFVLRWVLGVVLLVIVFWLGVKIGEFKGYFESGLGGYGYHHGMMYNQGFYPSNMMQYWGVPAADSSNSATDNTTTTTTTPKTTTPKK